MVRLLLSTLCALSIHGSESLAPSASLQTRPTTSWAQHHNLLGGSRRTTSPSINERRHGTISFNNPTQRCRSSLCMSDEASDAAAAAASSSSDDSSSAVSIHRKSKQLEKLDVDGNISSYARLISALPSLKGAFSSAPPDDLDRKILATALPTMLNMMVVPLVNAVDTFYVGQLADPLALAAQSAANQCFFTIYFLAAFLPTITAPLVAEAIGKEDWDTAKQRVCESLFLSNVLGGIFSLMLIGFPRAVLRMVLPGSLTDGAVAGGAMGVLDYAVPYLRWRAVGMLPALFSATGFAAYRGLLNTMTPLKVSLVTNLLNLVLDPLCIFGLGKTGIAAPKFLIKLWNGLGSSGAAAATSISEVTASLIYLRLLIRRKLIVWKKLFKPPKLESILPLIQGGLAMLLRQMTLNVAFVSAARRAQVMDPSGVAGAAYGITMQIYSLGVVAHLGVQGTAAALVPSSRAMGGDDAARKVADRIFGWGTMLGILLACVQWFALPMITPLFSPLPEVQEAVRGPAKISSFIHLVNGLVFAGEGTMLGLSAFRDLALITTLGVGTMVACLASPLGQTLNGVLISLAAFNLVQGLAVTLHHVRISPLRRRGFKLFRGKDDGVASGQD